MHGETLKFVCSSLWVVTAVVSPTCNLK